MERPTSPSTLRDTTDMSLQHPDSVSTAKLAAAKTNYLMTPEEQCATSFSPSLDEAAKTTLAPIHGLQSPPTSPAFRLLPDINSLTGISPTTRYAQPNYSQSFRPASTSAHPSPDFRDAALFPPETDRAHRQSPLFVQDEVVAPPHQPDTVLFSLDQPFRHIKTGQQAYDYWKRCCDDAARMSRVLPTPSASQSPSRDPISVRQLQDIEHAQARSSTRPTTQPRSQRVVKPVATQVREPTASSARRASRQKARATTPVTPTLKLHDAEKGSKHRRAPATKPRPVNESWTSIPDFCPPLSSLDEAGARSLKARAVGSSGPLDLSRDPDREHLHPAELAVASTLRLQCAKYLLNKRKIFKAKVEHLRAARAAAAGAASSSSPVPVAANFNKTEAQKACTIDVNKASSLFAAFEDVGWFREAWFEEFA